MHKHGVGMATLGQWNTLEILRESPPGLILDGGDDGEILMPKKYIYDGCDIGSTADVFLYTDSQDKLVATTERPIGVVGEFVDLECTMTTRIGAFMDMGLQKDLLVPFSNQKSPLTKGNHYLVYIYIDDLTNRMVGSTKLNKFLSDEAPHYREDQEVDLVIAKQTDLGYKAIINHSHWGLLYHNEIFQKLRPGQKTVGYIQHVREDGKVDLTLHKPAEEKVSELTDQILLEIDAHRGRLPLTDKSPPEDIYELFHVSKKTFKRAVGALYRERKIELHSDGITRMTVA